MEFKKIVFDLDGVLRNLYPIVRRKYGLWSPSKYEDWDDKGYNIYDLVEKDYSILENAKPTKYIKEVQKYSNKNKYGIEIWSHQPEDWIKPSTKWLNKYFTNFTPYWLNPKEKLERLKKEKNTILVEDNPNLKNYNRIWLISQKYNENIKCDIRIRTVKELRRMLNEC